MFIQPVAERTHAFVQYRTIRDGPDRGAGADGDCHLSGFRCIRTQVGQSAVAGPDQIGCVRRKPVTVCNCCGQKSRMRRRHGFRKLIGRRTCKFQRRFIPVLPRNIQPSAGRSDRNVRGPFAGQPVPDVGFYIRKPSRFFENIRSMLPQPNDFTQRIHRMNGDAGEPVQLHAFFRMPQCRCYVVGTCIRP